MAGTLVDSATDAVKAGRKAAAAAVQHAADLADQTRQLKAQAAEAVENARRAAARAVTRGVHRAQDARELTAYRIKRAPFTAVAIACGVGIVAGLASAWLMQWARSDRPVDD